MSDPTKRKGKDELNRVQQAWSPLRKTGLKKVLEHTLLGTALVRMEETSACP